jgi:hypothetical protein
MRFKGTFEGFNISGEEYLTLEGLLVNCFVIATFLGSCNKTMKIMYIAESLIRLIKYICSMMKSQNINMKGYSFLVPFLIIGLLISGCKTLTPLGENVNNSSGSSTDYLRRSFGTPTNIIDSGSIGQVWEYLQGYNVAKPGLEMPVGNKFKDTLETNKRVANVDSSAQNHPSKHYIRFWVKDDKVYKWSAEGYDIYNKHTGELILCTGGVLLLVAVVYAFAER